MKIAVCFSGQMRTAALASPNLYRFFGDLIPHIDFFIHTWDINRQKSYGTTPSGAVPAHRFNIPIIMNPVIPIEEEELNHYKNIYNPKMMSVESYKDYIDRYNRDPSLFYTWKKSLLCCAEYGKAYDVKYDMIIKLRPDVIFPPDRRLCDEVINFFKNPDIFYADNATENSLDDIFWIASPKTMFAISSITELQVYSTVTFVEYLRYMNIEIKCMVGRGYAPLRIESRHLDVMTQFGEIFYIDNFWFSDKEPQKWEK